jgi:hypothetical protein
MLESSYIYRNPAHANAGHKLKYFVTLNWKLVFAAETLLAGTLLAITYLLTNLSGGTTR